MLDLALGKSDAVRVICRLEILKYSGTVLFFGSNDRAALIELTDIGRQHGLAMLPPLQKPSHSTEFMTSLAARKNGERAKPKPARPSINAGEAIAVDIAETLRSHLLIARAK